MGGSLKGGWDPSAHYVYVELIVIQAWPSLTKWATHDQACKSPYKN